MASLMETMQANSLLYGANAVFVEEKYEIYLANPALLEPEWRQYFDAL
jgi:2-oxoglutarate dehydrogenase E1 component